MEFDRSLVRQGLRQYTVENGQWIWKDAKGSNSGRIRSSAHGFARRDREKKNRKPQSRYPVPQSGFELGTSKIRVTSVTD